MNYKSGLIIVIFLSCVAINLAQEYEELELENAWGKYKVKILFYLILLINLFSNLIFIGRIWKKLSRTRRRN